MQKILIIDHHAQSLLVEELKRLRPQSTILHAHDYREVLQAMHQITVIEEQAEVDLVIINANPAGNQNRLDPISLLLLMRLSGKLDRTLFMVLFDFPSNVWLTRAAQTAGADRIAAYPAYATHVAKMNRGLLKWESSLKRRRHPTPLAPFYRFGLSPTLAYAL